MLMASRACLLEVSKGGRYSLGARSHQHSWRRLGVSELGTSRFQLPIFITHRAFQLLTGRFQLGTSGFQLPIFITHRAFQLLTGRFQLGTSGFQLPIFSTHRAVLSAWGACHGIDLQVHYGNSTLLGARGAISILGGASVSLRRLSE